MSEIENGMGVDSLISMGNGGSNDTLKGMSDFVSRYGIIPYSSKKKEDGELITTSVILLDGNQRYIGMYDPEENKFLISRFYKDFFNMRLSDIVSKDETITENDLKMVTFFDGLNNNIICSDILALAHLSDITPQEAIQND